MNEEGTQVAVQEKVDAPASLYAKMVKVMNQLGRIPKNGYNAHFKYHFVTDADVLDAVRTAMAAENMCLFTSMTSIHQENHRTTVNIQLTFADSESGQSMSVHWVGEANDKQDKGIAKAATSALKYCLLKTFLIATGDTPDSDSDGPVATTKPNGLNKLLTGVNAALVEKALDTYNNIADLKAVLKQHGYTGYTVKLHKEMAAALIAHKSPPPETQA